MGSRCYILVRGRSCRNRATNWVMGGLYICTRHKKREDKEAMKLFRKRRTPSGEVKR